MKKTFVLILCLAFSAFSAEKEMKKKLIIHLKKPIIKLSDAKSEFTLNAIKISDESLKKTLDELDIQTIKRTVPSFKMENHTKENLNNKFFQISDLSLIYTISFKPDISKIEEYKNALSKLDNIKMVEFVYQYENTDETIIPNDDRFKYTDNNSNGVYNFGTDTPGRQWGLFDYYVSNPQNRADVSMPEAWDFSTGSSNIKIGFVESTSSAYEGDPINGITELKGRNSGSNGVSWGDNSHSVATAGIAIANTNNDHLVAGVDWNAKYYSAAHGNNSEEFASAIQSCVNENCNVINNSWSIEAGNDGSYSTMLAIRNALF
ncbi:MAG: S8 family serine peptidase [candidate division KSB1 bacterium]|nr:S8 family serine peptidase [candidate division KSB1 bacterium]